MKKATVERQPHVVAKPARERLRMAAHKESQPSFLGWLSLRTYIWGHGIDNLLAFTDHTTSNTYYAIKDPQNTILALVDPSGAVVESYEYSAYGETRVFSRTGTELAAYALGNRYTFHGREIDWTTGLMSFRARWYHAEIGRWLSKDPIGISGGLNLYVFCGNNPVNFVDPFGLVDTNMSGPATLGHVDPDDYAGKLGYFDVAVHGKENVGTFVDAGNNPISVGDVYNQMKADGYKDGTPFNLISCYAGLSTGDAQKLANLAGAKVLASTGVISLKEKDPPYWQGYGIKQTTDGEWVKKKPCGE